MKFFDCEVCGADLWLAESRHLGRCVECRFVERNQRLTNLVEDQRARRFVLGHREGDSRCRRCGARAASGQLCRPCAARTEAVKERLRELDQ